LYDFQMSPYSTLELDPVLYWRSCSGTGRSLEAELP